MGGVGIFLPVLIGCAFFCDTSAFLTRALMGGMLMLLVGVWDDIKPCRPSVKLAAQILAAAVGCGRGWSMSTAFAILWVVALANAHNFIDGMDGLFAGCAVTESLFLAGTLSLVGHSSLVLPTLLIASACLAFRHYNHHPARVFAGDCGSATVGYLFGVLSLPLFYEMQWQAGWLTPLFLFAYPLTDLFTAVTRRVLRGKSPFEADRAHLHHRLYAAGLDQRMCSAVLILISAMLSLVGIWLCTGQNLLAASLSCVLAASVLCEIGGVIYSA